MDRRKKLSQNQAKKQHTKGKKGNSIKPGTNIAAQESDFEDPKDIVLRDVDFDLFQTYEEMRQIWPGDTRDELRRTMDETMGFSSQGDSS